MCDRPGSYRQPPCRLVLENPQAELVGVCDIVQERADAAAAVYGAPPFYAVPEMLRTLAPDVCIVATGGVEYVL